MQEQGRQPEHEHVGGDEEVPTGLPAQRGCLFFRGIGVVPLSWSEVSYIFRHLVWRGVSQNCVLSDPSTAYGIRTIAVFTHRPCPRITPLFRVKAVLYNLSNNHTPKIQECTRGTVFSACEQMFSAIVPQGHRARQCEQG